MSILMEHFSNSEWVDLVRGIPTGASAVMRSHVDAGCAECVEAYRVWNELAAFAARDRQAEPPEDSVRVAKAYVATEAVSNDRAPQRHSWMTPVVAALVFDSVREALPAGVRSGAPLARHLMYRADAFIVDLQISSDHRSGHRVLAGQIVATTSPAFPDEQLVVSVAGAGRELATVYPNRFGEFEYELDRSNDDLTLTVAMSDGARILIPLDLGPQTPCNTRIE